MPNFLNAVIDGVETALALISTGNGYNFDLGSQEFLGAVAPDQVSGSRPRVFIVDVQDDLERFTPSTLYARITVTIRGITAGENYRQLQDSVLKLRADIEKAMYSDHTLGGAVTHLVCTGGSLEFQRESQHAVTDVSFVMDLHYTEGTP